MATKKSFSILRSLRFLALLVVFYAIWQGIQAMMFFQNAMPVDGIILEFVEHDAPFNPSQTPVIAYVDYWGGKHLETPENALGTETLVVGRTVAVLYDYGNPELMKIDTPWGLWGTSGIWLALGVVPWLVLSFLIGVTGGARRAPRRVKRRPKRKKTIKAQHLLGHDPDATDLDRPVVRRMR